MTEENHSILVLKFGGAAVSQPESFAAIARLVLARRSQIKKIVVVVSAMGKTTDELIALAHQVHQTPPQRELDLLISVGERISMALLAMALQNQGAMAFSFTGSQVGIITSNDHFDAKIIDVKPKRLLPHLDQGHIVVVAGFQGMSLAGDVTTLGRGGSDTTAVALAVALGSAKVEFYKDVPGVFSQDPKTHTGAQCYSHLSYDRALDIVEKGAKVLHGRSLLLAKKNNILLHVLPFDPQKQGLPGTLVGDLSYHPKFEGYE